MSNRHCLAALVALALSAPVAQAQFTGPSARGQEMTVAAATSARPGTYVTMTGTVVSHLRGDYYLFAIGGTGVRGGR